MTAARGRAAELGCTPIEPGGAAALTMLAAAVGARSVVEVGTGAGVSGLCLLAGMRPDGVLTTVDIESDNQRAAKTAFTEAGIAANRYRLINGSAAEVLPRLTDGAYDLVYVDADKTGYAVYHEQASGCCAPAASSPTTTCSGTTGWPTRPSATATPRRCASSAAPFATTSGSSARCSRSGTGCWSPSSADRSTRWPPTSTRRRAIPTPACASPSSATCWPTPATNCTRWPTSSGCRGGSSRTTRGAGTTTCPTHLRTEAVRLGAVELTMHEVGALLRRAERAERGDQASRVTSTVTVEFGRARTTPRPGP